VFTGTRGRQLAGRGGLICTGAFPYHEEWIQLWLGTGLRLAAGKGGNQR